MSRIRVLLIVIFVLGPARAGAVSWTCGSDPLANTQVVLCGSGSCSASAVRVTAAIEIPSGSCELDLGGRSLSLERTVQVSGLGGFVVTNAGDVTVTSTGRLKARGDFVKPNNYIIGGGVIAIESTGTIDVAGLFDVSGDGAGSIRLDARGDVILRSGSSVTANGMSSSADEGEKYADGGSLEMRARTGSVTVGGDLSLTGSNQATGGTVDVTAGRDFVLNRSMDLSGGGGDGGELDVSTGDHITINAGVDARSRVGGGFGGVITLAAGEDGLGGVAAGGMIDVVGASLILQGSATDTYGGDGGELDVTSAGRIRFFGAGVTIRVDAATNFDGSGGAITIDSGDADQNRLGPSDGDLQIGGVVTMRSGTIGGDGGAFSASAGRDLAFTAALDASGTDAGGDVTVDAGRSLTLAGTIATQSLSAGGDGGYVDVAAGLASDEGGLGTLTVQKDVLAVTGSASSGGQIVSLAGCGLAIAPNVRINGSGGTNPFNGVDGGAAIELVARRPMQLGAGSRYLAAPGGSITTTHPPGQNPVLGSGVIFSPARVDNPQTVGSYPSCPVCGDGVRQLGETCDRGAAADGACCNASCTAWLCLTPTPTPTVRASRTPTPTRTSTPPRTVAPTASGGASSPAATPSATETAITTATPTPSLTVSSTPSPTTTGVAVVDHYQCHAARTAPGTRAPARRSLLLSNTIETTRTTVVKSSELCVPVDKDGRGIGDASAALQCFIIRAAAGEPRFRPRDTTTDDDFGATRLRLKKAERLCVPVSLEVGTVGSERDAFKCYTAKVPAGVARFTPVTVDLADRFGSGRVLVRRPASVCTSVARDGVGLIDPAAILGCYDLKRSGTARVVPRLVDAVSAFGSERLLVRQAIRVCLAPGTAPPPPACGNGRIEGDEQCDDGNHAAGDGCSPSCGLESCGNGLREGGEECDEGPGNGRDDCCSVECRSIDPDGDGVCSRDDLCPDDADNDSDGDRYCLGARFHPPAVGGGDACSRMGGAGTWEKLTLVLGRLDRGSGEHTLVVKGRFMIPPDAHIDPRTRGLRLRLADAEGSWVHDHPLQPGTFSAATHVGWKTSGKDASTFTYLDKGRPTATTVVKAVVRDRSSKVPGLIEVTIIGQRANYGSPPDAGALLVAVSLDDGASPPGSTPGVDRCGETMLRLESPAAECVAARGTLRCLRRADVAE